MNRQITVLAVVSTLVAGLAAEAAAELEAGGKAPEIAATDWLNTPPLTLSLLMLFVIAVIHCQKDPATTGLDDGTCRHICCGTGNDFIQ